MSAYPTGKVVSKLDARHPIKAFAAYKDKDDTNGNRGEREVQKVIYVQEFAAKKDGAGCGKPFEFHAHISVVTGPVRS